MLCLRVSLGVWCCWRRCRRVLVTRVFARRIGSVVDNRVVFFWKKKDFLSFVIDEDMVLKCLYVSCYFKMKIKWCMVTVERKLCFTLKRIFFLLFFASILKTERCVNLFESEEKYYFCEEHNVRGWGRWYGLVLL